MEAWGRVLLQERVTACQSISTVLSTARRGSHQDYPKSSNVPVDEPKRSVRDATSQKKEAEKLEFEAWPGFRSFQIRRMNFRSAVSSSGKGEGLFQGMLGQAAADPRGSGTCVCANTLDMGGTAGRRWKGEVTFCRGTILSAW